MSDEIERKCNKCDVTKPLDDFPNQKGCRNNKRSTCKQCMALKTAAWRNADPERAKASQRAVKERNPDKWYEKERARTRKYKANNREKVIEAGRKYTAENPHIYKQAYERNREKIIARSAEWVRNNPERARVNSLNCVNRRRAKKLMATPSWADHEAIAWIYAMREEICEMTGESWHVDHIVPIKNKFVCGLHVEWNLRIIPAEQNRRKANKFDPWSYEIE